MSLTLPPIPQTPISENPAWRNWFQRLSQLLGSNGTSSVNSSNINHNSLSGLQGGGAGEEYHLTAEQQQELTGYNDTQLHYHSDDRDRSNHTGIQTADTITGLRTAILNRQAIFLDKEDKSNSNIHIAPPPKAYDFNHVTFPAQWTLGSIGHIYTLQEWMNHIWSSGVTDGAIYTDNGNGTIGLSSAVGVIRSTNDPHGQFYGCFVPAQTPISLTDNSINYVYLSYNAGSPTFLVTTSLSPINGTTNVLVYVVHRQGTVLHHLDVRDQNVDALNKISDVFYGFSPFIHESGGSILGSSALAVTVTSGAFYFQFQRLPHIAFDTTVAGTANANVFALWYRNGVGGWTEVANSKVIDTTVYDANTGTPAVIGNNKYGVTWFYIVNDSPSELHAVMGENQYATLADAAAAQPPGSLPTLLSGFGALIGFVAYQKGNTVFDNVYSAFNINFVATQPTIHNGLAGLQGGTTNEYYHLTSAQYSALITKPYILKYAARHG